jgi:hypothetical protein
MLQLNQHIPELIKISPPFTMIRDDGDAKLDEVEMVEGVQIALKKLTGWLEANIANKTKIYFAGSSPTHTW